MRWTSRSSLRTTSWTTPTPPRSSRAAPSTLWPPATHTSPRAGWPDASAYVSEGRCYKDLVLPSAVTDEQGRLLQEYYVGSVTKDEMIQRLDEVYAQTIAG